MTFKNQRSAHLCLCAPTHLPHKHQKISEVTGPKFTKFLHNVDGLSGESHSSVLWSALPWWNASAQNEDMTVCQFSQTRATNRLPQQRPVSISIYYYKTTNRSIFAECWVKITLYDGNNENVRIFACVHPPTACKLATTSEGFTALNFTNFSKM